MLRFHASVHGSEHADPGPLAISFDAALAALESLPRLFVEPDGSFVWTGTGPNGQPWQVDGNLIDRGECLAYVELKGSCPTEQFDALLRTLGWPAARLLFQLTQQGIFLDEPAFRIRAAAESGAR
jgi:hypothetical protein